MSPGSQDGRGATRVITDLVQIRRRGEHKRDENLRFRRWMKSHDFVERRFRRKAQEIEMNGTTASCAATTNTAASF
jgi:hypothetical protein